MQDRHLCWSPYILVGPAVPPPHFIHARIATVTCRNINSLSTTSSLFATTEGLNNIRAAMSNLRAACGPVEGFVRPSLGFRCRKSVLYILTTCPYFHDLEFNIFDAGGLQCHFITTAAIAVRIKLCQYISLS